MKKNKISKEELLSKFVKIHGDLYDYSLVEIGKSKDKIKIICKKHGMFLQTYSNHLAGKNVLNVINLKNLI